MNKIPSKPYPELHVVLETFTAGVQNALKENSSEMATNGQTGFVNTAPLARTYPQRAALSKIPQKS